MADTSAPDAPAVTGSVAFYKRPEPLDRNRHDKLGVVRNQTPFLFARTTNIVPITMSELAAAALYLAALSLTRAAGRVTSPL